MADDSDFPVDETMPPVLQELIRIFGDLDTLSKEPRPFLMLPLQGDNDALAFLRTVPAGTPWEQLVDLAVAYRARHPVPLTADS